ncbi:MAG TPA: GNAT family N-acetyltransferase [Thermoleophilia bacterium]|nr:GNAT family N-acetyltransferase [Thermoleophilia bacterium]
MAIDDRLLGPILLDASHLVDGFDCGVVALNDYIARQALSDQRAEKSRTFVAARGGRVVAYHSLAAASVAADDATERVAKGQGCHEIPAILIARFAVDVSEQGHGIGRAMLIDALARSERAADIVGVRVVLVHAKDDRARAFYLHHDFEPSPTDPLHLMMLMKDVRSTLDIS